MMFTGHREMQIKTAVRWHLIPARMPIVEKTKDVEESEPTLELGL